MTGRLGKTRRRKRQGPEMALKASVADYYRHVLSMPAHEPGEPAPTYSDYLKWAAQ